MPSLNEKLHALVERSGLTGAVTASQSFDDELAIALNVTGAIRTLAMAAQWTGGGDLAAMAESLLATPEARRLSVYLEGFDSDSD